MKVLFIGGTGIISSACTQLALERGLQLTLLNRGKTKREIPAGAEILHGDIRNPESVGSILGSRTFDVVVDWIAFAPDQIDTDIRLFRDRTAQFIFISSASVYQTPPRFLPITESSPLSNPYWAYSRDKIACEERLRSAFREQGFPITIVRPSHTYDRTSLPMRGNYTAVSRMREGKKVIVHGDGASLWTLTHHRDFAKGFAGLLGDPRAIGETFHITSDELLSWNQIFEIVAEAAGAEAHLVHVPSDVIAAFDPEWGASLLGDKTHSVIFDNSKIKRIVPGFVATILFSSGAREIIHWFDADPSRQKVDEETNQLMDRIIDAWQAVLPM